MAVVNNIAKTIFSVVCLLTSFNNFSESSYIVSNVPEEGQLIFAHVVFRHGDSNLMTAYPKSLYKDDIYWPDGRGSLTKNGMRAQYELGKYLRARYQNLIGPGYSPNQVYVRSTDEDRNLMSTECTMAGLFAPTRDEIWNENLNWRPVPIHTMPLPLDYLLNSFVECPRFDQLFQQRLDSPDVQGLMEKHKSLIEFMARNSGETLRKVDDVWKLYSGLVIENRRGLFTDWVKEALKSNDILEHISSVSYQSATFYTEMKKIRAGFLIKEILDRFTNKTLSLLKPDRSLYIYAIHSTGMVNILNSLNLFEELHIPPLSSSILFELYKHGDEYFIQVFYRKTVSDDAPPVMIPKCGVKCPLARFYELYKDILPTSNEDFNTLCRPA